MAQVTSRGAGGTEERRQRIGQTSWNSIRNEASEKRANSGEDSAAEAGYPNHHLGRSMVIDGDSREQVRGRGSAERAKQNAKAVRLVLEVNITFRSRNISTNNAIRVCAPRSALESERRLTMEETPSSQQRIQA